MWLFDTGLNPKRNKQLRLLFVDRHTAFPIGALQPAKSNNPSILGTLLTKPILINEQNLPTTPGNDKRITFTLNNKQVVCLVQFSDFHSCQEFYNFLQDLTLNPKHASLFNQQNSDFIENYVKKTTDSHNGNNSMFSFMRSYKSKSQSLLSLNKYVIKIE